jgi:anti-anti-sigma factor
MRRISRRAPGGDAQPPPTLSGMPPRGPLTPEGMGKMNNLIIQKQNNHLRIIIKGELASRMFWLFESRMKEEIEPFMSVEINLNAVEFIDSSGIGFLLSIKNAVERKGGTFFLASPSFRTMRVLNKLLLNTVFNVIDDAPQFKDHALHENAGNAESTTYAWNSEQFAGAALATVA